MLIPRRALWCLASLWLTGGPYAPLAQAQNFSEWTQASAVTQVEYRWKRNETKGCDIEYRNIQDRGRKKYKARVVFQTNGEEHNQTNAIVTFTEVTTTASDHVAACTVITDVTVTRF
jgi:hypothetical protein